MAEAILSLVVPQKRASATIGDIEESSKDAFGFWVAVTQTTITSLWMALAADPRETGKLTGRVFLRYLRLQVLFTFVLMGAVIVTAIARNMFGQTWILWLPGAIEMVGRGVWLPYLLGRWGAQQKPQTVAVPVLAFFAMLSLSCVISLAMGLSFVAPSGIKIQVWQMLLPMPGFLFALIGAARERHAGARPGAA
ncbi:MAG: hypothetical protein ABIR70_22225 [Bryobacteraceae bacterium]